MPGEGIYTLAPLANVSSNASIACIPAMSDAVQAAPAKSGCNQKLLAERHLILVLPALNTACIIDLGCCIVITQRTKAL